MNFVDAVTTSNNQTVTTNGAAAYVSTCDKVLDFFGQAASKRGQDTSKMFNEAFNENPDLAVRALLWVRDVRGGAGEREIFRSNLKQLLKNKSSLIDFNRVLDKIPEVGRWDDLFVAFDTDFEVYALGMIWFALKQDNNALCAKWMPRKGVNAEKIRKHLGLTPKQYRKLLVGLTQVVETQMCSGSWDNIEYQKVPSNAHNIYKTAFGKHSPELYAKYKESLTKGEVKINASTLYPHQVVKSLDTDKLIANAQWNALPNYIPADSSVLPMIDLSASMRDASACKGYTAMDVAIALGLYTATKNTGVFKNLWLNFSEKPQMYQLSGNSLSEYKSSLDFQNWGGSTNIKAAFQLILKVAVENNVPKDQMPKTLMIFSDMQFNIAVGSPSKTLFHAAKQMFEEAGYDLPNVVFWNLNTFAGNVPVQKNEQGAMLVSGFSPAIMEAVLANDFEQITPKGLMLKVLLKNRYNL